MTEGLGRRISHIAPGRFHHIDLCRQLEQREVLDKFFVAYPTSKLKKDGLPMGRVMSFPYIWPLYMLLSQAGLSLTPFARLAKTTAESTLSKFAAKNLDASDALIALACSGLEAGRKMKEKGGIWICDRPCTHIKYQDDVLREEHEYWGVPYVPIDETTVWRELQEYEEADKIVVPSSFAYDSFVEYGVPAEKVVKIPYGVAISEFYPIKRKEEKVFRVLFVGGVNMRKGVGHLVSAMSRLKGPVELVLVGSVSPNLQSIMSSLDMNNVRVVGRQGRHAVKRWMQNSDVLVLPSIEDGFGLVLAEALACGCPVIGTTHTGIREIVDDGVEGMVVPPRDVPALSDALQALMDDRKLLARMREAGLAKVQHLRGWDAYGDAVVTLVEEMLVGKSVSVARRPEVPSPAGASSEPC